MQCLQQKLFLTTSSSFFTSISRLPQTSFLESTTGTESAVSEHSAVSSRCDGGLTLTLVSCFPSSLAIEATLKRAEAASSTFRDLVLVEASVKSLCRWYLRLALLFVLPPALSEVKSLSTSDSRGMTKR